MKGEYDMSLAKRDRMDKLSLTSSSWSTIFDAWFNDQVHERLGQHFVNRYIKGRWPELFGCRSASDSKRMIVAWLEDNQYLDIMPQKVRDI